MKSIWRHVYTGLKAVSKEHAVLLTEPCNNPMTNRSLLVDTFFESFDVPALFVAPQPVLSLYAFGRTTGLVLESGDGVTQCVPVYEGIYFALKLKSRLCDTKCYFKDRPWWAGHKLLFPATLTKERVQFHNKLRVRGCKKHERVHQRGG